LQIPTTLPTLDELMGRPEYPEERLIGHYLSLLRIEAPNVLTIHAEIEGMQKLGLFRELLEQALARGVRIVRMCDLAERLLAERERIPICELALGTIVGRSGSLAIQYGADAQDLHR